MTFAIVTVFPEPVTPRSVTWRSAAPGASTMAAEDFGWSPARSHGSASRNGAFAVGRSSGTWSVWPRGMPTFDSRTDVLGGLGSRTYLPLSRINTGSTPVQLSPVATVRARYAQRKPRRGRKTRGFARIEEGKSGR